MVRARLPQAAFRVNDRRPPAGQLTSIPAHGRAAKGAAVSDDTTDASLSRTPGNIVTADTPPPVEYLRDLSGGIVVDALPTGPVLDRSRRQQRQPSLGTFVYALSGRDRILMGVLTAVWAVTLLVFWTWWALPEHRVGWAGFVLNTALMVYVTSLPVYFFIMVNRIRVVSPSLPLPQLRVAMAVTKAPAEPWPLARGTLEAMLGQRYSQPYDVWLCDEAPSAETLQWCADHGVLVSTRRDQDGYHRTTWPRRRRCKEGNLAWFYDQHGYAEYDVVSQFDCDHVPEPTYLEEILRPFSDPAIGYVAAPSVCDDNHDVSWAVRGRLYHEGAFHGALQVAHNSGYGPACIGSHYAVRTQALRSVGGIGPELAEDFSTAYLLNVAGWQGAMAIEANARGQGPDTFRAMITQEFQWSRSLTILLFTLMPRTLGALPRGPRLRFFFSLVFTPLVALTAVAGLILVAVAAVFGIPWVKLNYFVFLAYWWGLSLWVIVTVAVLRARGLLRPRNVRLISWERWLYVLSRWPFICWGAIAAFAQVFSPRHVDFKVTPKGQGEAEALPTSLVLPFTAVSLVLTASAFAGMPHPAVVGYVALCLFSAAVYVAVPVAVCLLHAHDARRRAGGSRPAALVLVRRPLLITLLAAVPTVVAFAEFPAHVVNALSG